MIDWMYFLDAIVLLACALTILVTFMGLIVDDDKESRQICAALLAVGLVVGTTTMLSLSYLDAHDHVAKMVQAPEQPLTPEHQ